MIYYTWSVFWSNPYTEPPAGMPRYLMKGVLAYRERRWSSRYRPPCIDMVIDYYRSQGEYGWSIGVTSHDMRELSDGSGRTRTLSEQSKQKLRRTRLRKRLAAKYPLFAEQWYQEAIAAQPDYYGCW